MIFILILFSRIEKKNIFICLFYFNFIFPWGGLNRFPKCLLGTIGQFGGGLRVGRLRMQNQRRLQRDRDLRQHSESGKPILSCYLE
jgi:hypothetical protein